jgi:DNA helicase HerA-like ATPase
MVSRRAWEAYPATYREREVEILANWVRMGESGSVVGSAGAGKSNLLGFLCARPEVITRRFVSPHPLALALVLVDLNGLPSSDLSTFYRVIMRSLYEARAWLAAAEPSLPPAVEALYRKAEAQTDPFVSQSALREALLAFRERDIRLVLALDPFDAFCRAAPTQVLDTLRGLRDSFKGTLSYLVGLRRELVYLRDPAELGELYELLDTHVCWLGPMERQDARWVIA